MPVAPLTDHLADAVGQAVPEAVRGRVVAVNGGFAGAAGAGTDDPGRRNALAALTGALQRLGITPRSVGVSTDVEAVFASAPGAPADGLALIAGTGAVAVRLTGRCGTAVADGDGRLLGDDGSGCDAPLPLPGGGVCALSSLTGVMLVQMAVAEATAQLLAAGERPPVYVSANVPGGFEGNLEPEKRYEGRIRRTAS